MVVKLLVRQCSFTVSARLFRGQPDYSRSDGSVVNMYLSVFRKPFRTPGDYAARFTIFFRAYFADRITGRCRRPPDVESAEDIKLLRNRIF